MAKGALLAKDPQRLAETGIRYIIANCSAGSPETYVKYHPNQEVKSFYKFKEHVQIMFNSGVPVELNCVLCAVNYRDILNMLEFAAQTSKLIRFKNMHLREAEDRGLEKALLTQNQLTELKIEIPKYIEIADSLGLNHNLVSYKHFLHENYHGNKNYPIEQVSCFAPYYTSMVRANGNLVVCCHSPTEGSEFVLGNIERTSFKEIWFSDEYKEIRKKLKRRQYFDFCKYCEYYAYFQHNAQLTNLISTLEKDKNWSGELRT
jgi:radical SAM protein with 4Fe4S-binding SPASM domain